MLGLGSRKLAKCYHVVLLCSVLAFFSCGSKQWDLSSDKFEHTNLLRFDGSDALLSELEPVSDVDFLKYFMTVAYWEPRKLEVESDNCDGPLLAHN